MTGRFFRGPVSWQDYAAHFDIVPPEGIEPPEPRYNIPPSSWVPVIRSRLFHEPGQELALMMWGLVPSWWTRPLSEKKWNSFTARCETIDEAPAFRGAYRYRRCLIPASGFFVWSGADKKRLPVAIGLTAHSWFCFAGIWETWGHNGGEIDTFALLTTRANDLVGAYSNRMPVILRPCDWQDWLDTSRKRTARLFDPFPDTGMEEWPADPSVGNTRNQGQHLVRQHP